ncbi:hypothetical protein [Streptococcus uberis]|uniref:hypothetical protein n=1 Tax=Streptococcus uberis TaxID=1349 RepID=UPI0018A7A1DF|nr:hypothetical protein [Streptococcus uberis]
MPDKNPLKESINKKISNERYKIPKVKKQKKNDLLQNLIVFIIIVGLILSVISLVNYFM